ncbi:MAG: YdcF family protein [Sphingobacteriales bacterium]|nr:MAG: YdcF family protein [Sphingobacteriales bacterium]
MFFFLSKMLVYLLYPLSWVLVLLLCALIFKKKRKFFNIAALVVFLIFSNGFLLNKVCYAWDIAPVELPAGSKYNCAIILGGFQSEDKNEKGYFNTSADRFIQTLKLYKEGYVSKIMVTGGSGKLGKTTLQYSSWAKDQFVACGVPAQDIFVEDESRNTFENAQYSKRVLDAAGIKPPYVLVTSASHMRRAQWVFEHEKMQVVPFPCNYTHGRDDWYLGDFFPNSTPLTEWYHYYKEIIGLQVYKIKGKA